MAGGIMDLVAKGMEDIYLITDAQITLFKAVFRRPTNFSMYDKVILPSATGNFSTQLKVDFDSCGDLLHKVWMVVEVPKINIKKQKSTFSRISSILKSVNVNWNYAPSSSDAIASLANYNGATTSAGTSIIITDIGVPIGVNISSTVITMTNGYIKVGNSRMRISSGVLNLSTILSLPLTSFPTFVTISSGQIQLLDSSVFGNVFYEFSGTALITSQTTITSLNLVAEYKNSIINVINTEIQTLINDYNYFVNLNNVTTNSDYTLGQFTEVFDNLDVQRLIIDQPFVDKIKSLCHTGRNLFMYMISHYMIRYNSNYFMINSDTPYTNNTGTKFLPIDDDNYVISLGNLGEKNIQMYSQDFKNALITVGILTGALFHYVYDASVLNTSGENFTGSDETFITQPLFGDILQRPTNTAYDLIHFNLYSSDDIRYLFYISFINNITRLKIVSDSSQLTDFDPRYATILKSANIGISNANLDKLGPDVVAIDEMVLFYHTIDSDITNYVVYQYNIGENTSVYFDNNIGSNYSLYDKYQFLIPVNRGPYTDTDSYKIYRSYMQNSISNDIVNSTIKSEQQVKLIANILKYNIDSNIRFNFGQILNNMTVLSKSTRDQSDHYILNFYKSFLATGGSYIPSAGASFIPVVDSSSVLLKDNFKTVINTVIPVQVPSGIVVTNYFNNYIQDKIKTFITQCQGLLKGTNYLDYLNDYSLWERLLINTSTPMINAYNIGKTINSAPTPDSTVFGRIALMNYLPLLVAKDLPRLLYDTFTAYTKQLFIDIGADTSSDTTAYDGLLAAIDFRDSDDSGLVPSTESGLVKKEIYNRIIMNCFVTTYSGTSLLQIDNNKFYTELQAEKSTGQYYLISCSLRPDSFFCQYSVINESGSPNILTDVGTNLIYLPIEWLTQTYYHIFSTKIFAYIDSITTIDDANKTLGKTLLQGILANVVNSFILRSNLPSYTDYINNDYLLLGLTNETNSTIQKYKKNGSTNKLTSSSYCDLMSSIWYQTQKGFIQQYNVLFNNTLLSRNYFFSNLGTSMVAIFDYIKEVLESTNTYYDSNTQYPNFLPDSLLDSFVEIYGSNYTTDIRSSVLDFVGELYPGIDTKNLDTSKSSGFDFYRLSLDSTNSGNITTYVKDYSALYAFILNYYNSHKSITLVKNDNDNILYTQSGLITGIRKKDTYAFEQSSIFTRYLQDHINIKYVRPANSIIKPDLDNLNSRVAKYWNPDSTDSSGTYVRNPNGIYGILDAIYNTNLTGNIYSVMSQFNTIPQTKTSSDLLDITYNPMTSFCLREYYKSLFDFKGLTYQFFNNSMNLFNSLIYSGSTKLITSQTILRNKNLVRLYTGSNGGILSNFSLVASFLFDLVLTENTISQYVDFTSLLQNVYNTTSQPFNSLLFINTSPHTLISGGTLDTLQEITVKIFYPMTKNGLVKLAKITSIGPSLIDNDTNNFILVNNLQQFIDEKNYSGNTDIVFYKQSTNGRAVINTPLETKLLSLLRNENPKFAWVKELGHKIGKKITISLGEQTIESYTPELMHLDYAINKSIEHERGYDIMIGNTPEFYTVSSDQPLNNILYIPLRPWFCKHAGNSVPMINLMYSNLTITVELNDLEKLLYMDEDAIFINKPKLKCHFLARYIYLDDDERTRIAGSKMEYLIEKYNYNFSKTFSQTNIFKLGGDLNTNITDNGLDFIDSDLSASISIALTDPIKYLVWYIKFRNIVTEQPIDKINWCNFGYNVRDFSGVITNIKNPIKSFKFKMNGVEREMAHDELYYNQLVPYSRNVSSLSPGEYMYSFALYPLLLQPTGSANYTEIPDSSIEITLSDEVINLFKNNSNLEMQVELWGQAYGVIRFASGMAGQVFMKA